MVVARSDAVGSLPAEGHRLRWKPNPVLALGREGRWRWPWLLAGLAVTWLLFVLLARAPLAFEDLALQQGWISTRFANVVFPFEPSRPLSYAFDFLCWLPYLLPPLIVLRLVHGVSIRRAFSYGTGFQWHQFCRAGLALFVVLSLGVALTYLLEPQQHRFRAPSLDILPWIALALGAVFVQTLGEDVFYLGYLYRTLGAVLAFRLPAAVAVTAYFISNHLPNEDVQRDVALAVIDFTIMMGISIGLFLRTQNLAASAALHWVNNVFILLRPSAPEAVSPLALIVYTDPVYAAGGSYLYNPSAHAGGLLSVALLMVLLLWRRSPFYLAKAPVP